MNASFEDRLILDRRSIDELVHQVISEIHQLRADSFVARILQRKDIDAIRDWEQLLMERGGEPFSLVIMGDFKRGKSTLINAILGKNTVTTNATPETVTINRIKYGETPQVEAVLSNGMRVRLEHNELSREVIESLAKNFPAPIDHIDISEKNELLRDICITDTPGLGDILKCFDKQVQDYLIHADAVIYVVSALSPLSESEQLFLSSMISPQGFSRLFVIVNFADCLDNEGEIENITELVLERARAISPSAVVYPVSALGEFNRKTGRKAPNPELDNYLSAAFQRFENMLEHDLLLNKDVVRAERITALLQTMLKDVRAKIMALCSLLTVQVDKLAEEEQLRNNDLANINDRLVDTKQALNNFVDSLYTVTDGWMREYLKRVEGELRTLDKLPAQDLQKHLQFYLMDMIREAAARCLKEHRHAVEEEARRQLIALGGEKLVTVTDSEIKIATELSDISWTTADSAVYFTGVLQGYGIEIGGLFVDAIVGLWREAKVKNSSGKIMDALLANFSAIETSCMAQLRKMYDALAAQAVEHIESAYKKLINNSIDELKQAQEILRAENVKKDEVESKLAFATQILDSAEQLVEKSGFVIRNR